MFNGELSRSMGLSGDASVYLGMDGVSWGWMGLFRDAWGYLGMHGLFEISCLGRTDGQFRIDRNI